MENLTIAVPKGRLLGPLARLLQAAGIAGKNDVFTDSRKLILSSREGGLTFILSKPVDVPTYVEYGAADLGVVGKDVLLEAERGVSELLDLKFGKCEIVVAVPEDSGIRSVEQLGFNARVATKYPGVATMFFNKMGLQVEVVKLNGSIELAPIVGLAEAIVDISSTGTTLRENGLVPIARVCEVTARLVVNPVSYKIHFDEITRLAQRMSSALEKDVISD